MNYGPDRRSARQCSSRKDRGAISVYARGDDYHDLIKSRLKALARWLIAMAGGDVKVFVDTAAVMEKPLAAAAGIGWQGKHTNLVSREYGSWLFLGAIFTTLDLPPDERGSRPLRHMPRLSRHLSRPRLFPRPISSMRGAAFRISRSSTKVRSRANCAPLIGNRIYGCDDCLAVCPWNKFAQAGHEAKLAARETLRAPALAELARLDDAGFRSLFARSPVKRTGRDRFLRNVLIAIGKARDGSLANEAERLLDRFLAAGARRRDLGARPA